MDLRNRTAPHTGSFPDSREETGSRFTVRIGGDRRCARLARWIKNRPAASASGIILLFVSIAVARLAAQELDVARIFDERNLKPVQQMIETGDYELAARICQMAIGRGQPSPEWRIMRVKSLAALGEIDEALQVSAEAIAKLPDHLPLLMQRHDLAKRFGRKDIATQMLAEFNKAARGKPARERTAPELVALGQAALALGADARKVIDQYFDPAKKKDPKAEAPYLAAGELALEKEDFARAADEFRVGLKEHGETAALRFGLARAFAPSDREKAAENIRRVFEINEQHEGALLLKAEQLIGAEKYVEAEAAVQAVIDTNAVSPEAWALRSAIAAILADEAKAVEHRASALKVWPGNPAVDQIIGRCLSQAYRFAEAAEHLQQALKFDPNHLPAKVQLCHALMRLGHEDEAWKLAEEIRAADGYNLQAHNIGLLQQEVAKFVTKPFDDFIFRLPSRDWEVYGERALALLREAKQVLCAKYGLELNHPVLVEFFPSQQDFAIRTFGNLGGQGILGACFGSVVTMNSPGSLAHGRNNWESTLWHEFCHVVTLTVTKNRMPRWLSEGISVYEEEMRDPAWGMPMDAKFRSLIVDGEETTPVGQLSSAFLNPKTEEHVMFAYFQSSQVVKYLIRQFGEEKFRGILRDLVNGVRINDAISTNTLPISRIENDFAVHLAKEAAAFGARLDWKKPSPEEVNPLDAQSFAAFFQEHPTNHWALTKQANDLLEAEQWEQAVEAGQKLIDLVPEDTSSKSGYIVKAKALRQLKREDEEAAVLRDLAARSADVMPVFLRLVEIDTKAGRWDEVLKNAGRASALNPFLKSPQQAVAEALEALNRPDEAIAAFKRLLVLEADNPAEVRFRLARLLRGKDAEAAKRYLIDALVLAPRFRDAHRLLLEMQPPNPP